MKCKLTLRKGKYCTVWLNFIAFKLIFTNLYNLRINIVGLFDHSFIVAINQYEFFSIMRNGSKLMRNRFIKRFEFSLFDYLVETHCVRTPKTNPK